VRAGKYFEITLRAANQEEASALTTEMCRKLLANPVLEDFRFEIAPAVVESS
jgi:phosphoribosylformylglycinamidine synthase subunit PurS